MPDMDSPRAPPVGTIQIWSGLLVDIPQKWALCDGTQGTPNLIAKFVKGAPPSTEAGAIGGQDQIVLTTNQLPAHNHATSGSTLHSHQVNITNPSGGGPFKGGFQEANQDSGSFTWDQQQSGVTLQNAGNSGQHENRPPFFEVAYIMRLS